MYKKYIKLFIYLVISILILLYLYTLARNGGDFNVFLNASNALKNNSNIYNQWFNISDDNYGLYFYSPFFALILIPLTYLPFQIANLLWLILNLFFLYRIWVIVNSFFDFSLFNKKYYWFLQIVTFIFIVRFMLYNFGMIQMTIFLLYASLEGITLIMNKNKLSGSILIGLAANIKLLPILIIPYLFYRNQIKSGIYTVLFFVLLLFIPALFIGFDFNILLLKSWWLSINPANSIHTFGEVENGQHSLSALIPTLLMETTGNLNFKRNILNLDKQYVSFILNIVRIILIVFTLYFLKTLPFKRTKSKLSVFWEISYIFLITPLLFPHQQKYAFFYILPAVFYVIYFLLYNKISNYNDFSLLKSKIVFFLILLVFMLTTLTTDGIIGRYLNNITQYYRFITYGTLFLIIPLSMCNPKYLRTNIID